MNDVLVVLMHCCSTPPAKASQFKCSQERGEVFVPPKLLRGFFCEADTQNVECDLTAQQDKMRALRAACMFR